jgi:hypothetical protein
MVRTLTDVARELPPLGRQGRWVDGTFLPSTAWVRITPGGISEHVHRWQAVALPEGALGAAAECPCGARARWKPVSLGPEAEQATALEDLRRLLIQLAERIRRCLQMVTPSRDDTP